MTLTTTMQAPGWRTVLGVILGSALTTMGNGHEVSRALLECDIAVEYEEERDIFYGVIISAVRRYGSPNAADQDPGAGSRSPARLPGEQGWHPDAASLGDTIETEAGWAFFNANGFLGTVTPEGEVIIEDEFVEDE